MTDIVPLDVPSIVSILIGYLSFGIIVGGAVGLIRIALYRSR